METNLHHFHEIYMIRTINSLTIVSKEVTKLANRNNSNQLVVPGAEQAINQMKAEIAQEFGVQLGPDSTSRSNGSVGGEITKRLVHAAQQQIGGSQYYKIKINVRQKVFTQDLLTSPFKMNITLLPLEYMDLSMK